MKLKKLSNQKITFESFLCGISARDYIYQDINYDKQIRNAAIMIHNAEYVLIGAGAGMIRFPFEKLVREHDNISLIRLNLEQAAVPESFEKEQ